MSSAAPPAGGRLVWGLIPPLFLLLGFDWRIGPLAISLSGLWLPLAAWFGRYGARGVTVVAVAGLPLLVGIRAGSLLSTAGWLGLYIAAIIVCRLVALDPYRRACLAADIVTRRMLAFLFLAVGCDVFFQLGYDVSLDLSTSFSVYLWLLLVVLGLSAAPLRAVLLCLALAAVAGFLVRLLGAQMPSIAGFGIGYGIAAPHHVATGCAAILVGRLLRHAIAPGASGPPVPYGLAAIGPLLALLLLALALSMVEFGIPTLAGGGGTFSLLFSTGATTALLLFACGLVGGGRGAALASAIWLAACVALPLAVAEIWPAGQFQPIHAGPAQIFSPRVFVGTTLDVAPGMSIALFDLVFALLGWRIARQLSCRADGDRLQPATPAPATIPPPFRFRYVDRVGSVAGGLFVAGSLVVGFGMLIERLFFG